MGTESRWSQAISQPLQQIETDPRKNISDDRHSPYASQFDIALFEISFGNMA